MIKQNKGRLVFYIERIFEMILSAIGSFLASAATSIGSAIAEGATAAGSAIADGATAAGSAVAEGAGKGGGRFFDGLFGDTEFGKGWNGKESYIAKAPNGDIAWGKTLSRIGGGATRGLTIYEAKKIAARHNKTAKGVALFNKYLQKDDQEEDQE